MHTELCAARMTAEIRIQTIYRLKWFNWESRDRTFGRRVEIWWVPRAVQLEASSLFGGFCKVKYPNLISKWWFEILYSLVAAVCRNIVFNRYHSYHHFVERNWNATQTENCTSARRNLFTFTNKRISYEYTDANNSTCVCDAFVLELYRCVNWLCFLRPKCTYTSRRSLAHTRTQTADTHQRSCTTSLADCTPSYQARSIHVYAFDCWVLESFCW